MWVCMLVLCACVYSVLMLCMGGVECACGVCLTHVCKENMCTPTSYSASLQTLQIWSFIYARCAHTLLIDWSDWCYVATILKEGHGVLSSRSSRVLTGRGERLPWALGSGQVHGLRVTFEDGITVQDVWTVVRCGTRDFLQLRGLATLLVEQRGGTKKSPTWELEQRTRTEQK